MKPLVFISALLLSAASAHAFQETETAVMSDGPVSSLNSASVAKNSVKSPFSSPKEAIDRSERNEIHIPGFGVVGSLPKLNFGLELLYKDESEKSTNNFEQDEISIKGRLKHKF